VSELRVALTFDAEHPSRRGADPAAATGILDALAAAHARATFFVQGRWASAYPDLARRIAEEGHVVGNHSNYHAPMTLLTDQGIRTDVQEAEQRIGDATGADPHPWFRCPFGDGEDSPAVQEALARLGYRIVPWEVDGGDWQDDASPGDVEEAVADRVLHRAGNGSSTVVLLHTWPSATARTLPGLLGRLAGEGAVFVSVEEVGRGA